MSANAGKVSVKLLLAVVGAIATVVLMSTAFFRWSFEPGQPLLTQRFPLGQFVRDLPQHFGWLLLFVLLSASMIPLRAVLWQRTLGQKVPFKERYHLVAIGAFAHNALPGKLGDVIRAFLLSRSQKMPFVRSLGSVAVTKLLEFAALIAVAALSLVSPLGGALEQFTPALRGAAIACIALVVLVVVLAHWSAPLAHWLRRKHRLPKAQVFLDEVAEGLGAARSFRGLTVALLFAFPPVLANALAYGVGLWGMDLPGGLMAGALVLGAIALGQSAPGLPVGMGVYYFVTSWMARQLGATPEQGAAYATLTHLATLGTQLAVGGISLWVRRIGFKELIRGGRRARQRAREEAQHVADEAEARA